MLVGADAGFHHVTDQPGEGVLFAQLDTQRNGIDMEAADLRLIQVVPRCDGGADDDILLLSITAEQQT